MMQRLWGTALLYTLLSSKRSSRALKVLNFKRFSFAQVGRNDQIHVLDLRSVSRHVDHRVHLADTDIPPGLKAWQFIHHAEAVIDFTLVLD